jgi:hypothetical protein
MQPFIIEEETVLIKFRHLILNVSSYRDDLSMERLILISKTNYKIVLYKTCFISRLQVFYKITDYLADDFLRLKALNKASFSVSIYTFLQA